MRTAPFALQLAHKYNLKKISESPRSCMFVAHDMTLCHSHVTINVQASTQGRGGEGRRGRGFGGEKEVHVH